MTRNISQEIVMAKTFEGDRIRDGSVDSDWRCCITRLKILMGYVLDIVKLIVVIECCVDHQKIILNIIERAKGKDII